MVVSNIILIAMCLILIFTTVTLIILSVKYEKTMYKKYRGCMSPGGATIFAFSSIAIFLCNLWLLRVTIWICEVAIAVL